MAEIRPWLAHYDPDVPATLEPYPERTLLHYLSESASTQPDSPALLFKVQLPRVDPVEVPSLISLWPGADFQEREAWDLYGIRFTGHPNLKRVLMYDEFVGHPLRKDYPVAKRQPLIPMREIREIPTQRQPPRENSRRPPAPAAATRTSWP